MNKRRVVFSVPIPAQFSVTLYIKSFLGASSRSVTVATGAVKRCLRWLQFHTVPPSWPIRAVCIATKNKPSAPRCDAKARDWRRRQPGRVLTDRRPAECKGIISWTYRGFFFSSAPSARSCRRESPVTIRSATSLGIETMKWVECSTCGLPKATKHGSLVERRASLELSKFLTSHVRLESLRG